MLPDKYTVFFSFPISCSPFLSISDLLAKSGLWSLGNIPERKHVKKRGFHYYSESLCHVHCILSCLWDFCLFPSCISLPVHSTGSSKVFPKAPAWACWPAKPPFWHSFLCIAFISLSPSKSFSQRSRILMMKAKTLKYLGSMQYH